MWSKQTKEDAERLRRQGKTYVEICSSLSLKIPKSTLSIWFKELELSPEQESRIKKISDTSLQKAREAAFTALRKKREIYFKQINDRNLNLGNLLLDKDIAKVVLAVLYLCEGSKKRGGGLVFGNSDPGITSLFLKLFRTVYNVDEKKFRCTLQCRADQNTEKLQKFWSDVTAIPRRQFYLPRVDPRTIGKVSQNKDYKGVCRVDYFSMDTYNEVIVVGKILTDMFAKK